MTVKTEMMAKMPMVMPSNDKKVRNLFALSALKANEKLSNMSLANSIFNCLLRTVIKLTLRQFSSLTFLLTY